MLLEARGLQTTLLRYGETLPLENHTIYVYSTTKELPIVIDIGTSCSITPNLQDFIE